MEAIVFHSTPDQSISPYNRALKKNNRPFISRSSENLAPNNFHGGGLLFPPPYSLSYSIPVSNHFHHHQPPPPQQPPLLPLPITKPYNNNSPINRKTNNNRTRDYQSRPKKSKPSTTSPKKEVSKNKQTKSIVSSECLIIESTNRLGPEPKDLPKDVSKVLSLSSSNTNNTNSTTLTVLGNDQVDKFSGSVVFTLSPPPSSLPLPTFSLRPKLSCKAEAAGVDAGATDSLRRLLRLR